MTKITEKKGKQSSSVKKRTARKSTEIVAGEQSDTSVAAENPTAAIPAPADEPIEGSAAAFVPAVDGDEAADERVRRRLHPVKLADKLRRIRARHALTQGSMLLLINPYESENNRARVSQYENGSRIPSLIETYNYARFAGVPVEVLINDEFDLPKPYESY